MEFCSFDSRNDYQHNGGSFVVISEILCDTGCIFLWNKTIFWINTQKSDIFWSVQEPSSSIAEQIFRGWSFDCGRWNYLSCFGDDTPNNEEFIQETLKYFIKLRSECDGRLVAHVVLAFSI